MVFLGKRMSGAQIEQRLVRRGVPAAGNWVWARCWRPPVSAAEAQWDLANAYLLAKLEARPVVLVATAERLWVGELTIGWVGRWQTFELRRMTALTLSAEAPMQACLRFVVGGVAYGYVVAYRQQRQRWARLLALLAPADVAS